MRRLARVAERLRVGFSVSPEPRGRDFLSVRHYAPPPHDGLSSSKRVLTSGPGLSDFLTGHSACGAAFGPNAIAGDVSSMVSNSTRTTLGRTAYVETYGCQMNVSDSEIVASVLRDAGYEMVDVPDDADAILVNTCAIRDGAEKKIWHRLAQLRAIKLKHTRELKKQLKRDRQDVSGVFTGLTDGAGDDSNTNTKTVRESFNTKTNTKIKITTPVVGVLGCMGERLKEKLLQHDGLCDLVAGPDAYRDLPRLINAARGLGTGDMSSYSTDHESRSSDDSESATGTKTSSGNAVINVQLSIDETYADISPVRKNAPSVSPSAFVSIMRGCDNMCAFCIVPFTRGRERSRPFASVIDEVKQLSEEGYKEITLLGQNVNSYADRSGSSGPSITTKGGVTTNRGFHPELQRSPDTERVTTTAQRADPFVKYYAPGFRSVYKPGRSRDDALRFGELLNEVSEVDPELRIRFTSPHPKDFPDDVLEIVRGKNNVGKMLHMPAQSGSSSVLDRMKRGYTREAYLSLVDSVRAKIPDVAISSDFITGFCGETDEEHSDTLSLMKHVQYEHAFMFHYSARTKTYASRHFTDDVAEGVKKKRLAEIIALQRSEALQVNLRNEVGATRLVLIEGFSKKSNHELSGRTCANKKVVIHAAVAKAMYERNDGSNSNLLIPLRIGDYVAVTITNANASTLFAQPLGRTTVTEFYARG